MITISFSEGDKPSAFDKEGGGDSKQKLEPSDLRKAFPSLYKEYLHDDETDVVEFLKQKNMLKQVLEFLDEEEERDLESDREEDNGLMKGMKEGMMNG